MHTSALSGLLIATFSVSFAYSQQSLLNTDSPQESLNSDLSVEALQALELAESAVNDDIYNYHQFIFDELQMMFGSIGWNSFSDYLDAERAGWINGRKVSLTASILTSEAGVEIMKRNCEED